MSGEELVFVACVAPLVGFLGMYSGGFWGVGCGWLIVPTALICFHCTPSPAAGIGLLQMGPSILPSVVRETPQIGWGRGSLGRRIVLPAALGALATAFSGRPINDFFDRLFGAKALMFAFGVFMLFVGYKTLFGGNKNAYSETTPITFSRGAERPAFLGGLAAGIFSSVLGVGGAMVFRPILAYGFKFNETDTARSVRFLLLTTTTTGGLSYLFSRSGMDLKVLLLSGMIALGGSFGFPLGVRAHRIMIETGYGREVSRSFATICGIVTLNVALLFFDLKLLSQIVMSVFAILLFSAITLSTVYARKSPRRVTEP